MYGARALAKAVNVGKLDSVVKCACKTLYLKAAGESMTGVPTTTDMHFRNGAMAFTTSAPCCSSSSTSSRKSLSLNDKLSKFLPRSFTVRQETRSSASSETRNTSSRMMRSVASFR